MNTKENAKKKIKKKKKNAKIALKRYFSID